MYAIKSPGQHLVPETAAMTRGEVWSKAFNFLSGVYPDFSRRYWKRWEASQAFARRRGWRIVPVRLVEAREGEEG